MLQSLFRKTPVILFIITFMLLPVFSCGPSQYRHYKKMVRQRTTYYGYRSHYQKKLKRNALPINKNYIIRNTRTVPAWR